MLADIEDRFRSGSITKSDCDALKETIVAGDDESTLESAIYIYGRSCGFDQDVLEDVGREFAIWSVAKDLTNTLRRELEQANLLMPIHGSGQRRH